MLRLLPLNIQAHIFSYISVKERVLVLETISGGEAAGQRIQANFRRAVLESYKSVRTLNELGPNYTKLKFLQTTGEQMEGLKRRFPKLAVEIDGSELQGFVFASRYGVSSDLRIAFWNGRETFNQATIESAFFQHESDDVRDDYLYVRPNNTTVMIIQTVSKTVRLLNLIDLSVRNCAPLLHRHQDGDALIISGFVYVVGGSGDWDRACERYNLDTDSWERIADVNDGRSYFSLVEWNASLCAVGGLESDGTVERYDPEKNAWEVLFEAAITQFGDDDIRAAVVVDDDLYCCVLREEGPVCAFCKLDMRTGAMLEWFDGKEDYPQHLYVKERNIYLLEMMNNKYRNFYWTTYVLDQSKSRWQLLNTGVLQYSSQDAVGLLFAIPIFL